MEKEEASPQVTPNLQNSTSHSILVYRYLQQNGGKKREDPLAGLSELKGRFTTTSCEKERESWEEKRGICNEN